MYGDTVGVVLELPGDEKEPLLDGSQLNMVMLKNVATKVPGRNRVVSTAIVFMAVESRILETAMAALYSESFWVMRLST
jgi:hypothetical protein